MVYPVAVTPSASTSERVTVLVVLEEISNDENAPDEKLIINR